jgi:hypothetical protein
MRDTERFVQVEVTDIGTEGTRLGNTDECVQVGAVYIHLTTVVVNEGAHVGDTGLEHAVSRRVGDHECSQSVAGLFTFGGEVNHVNIAVFVARHDDNV